MAGFLRDGNGGGVSESSGQWLKGCAFGCGGLVALCVLLIVGMTVSVRSAFDDAHEDRKALVERFGDDDAFVPAMDGSVAATRVEAFLAVREALAGVHAEIEDVDREMGELDAIEEGEEPPLREALPMVFRLTRSMMGLPWIFGEIERTRNRALVENGMGLGEYTYIFVMAYHEQIVHPSENAVMFSSSPAGARVRGELRGMLERQLLAAESHEPPEEDLVSALAAELEALDSDAARVPWQDGLPESIATSFAGYRDRLDAAYSTAAAEFELLNSTVHGGGLRIEMN